MGNSNRRKRMQVCPLCVSSQLKGCEDDGGRSEPYAGGPKRKALGNKGQMSSCSTSIDGCVCMCQYVALALVTSVRRARCDGLLFDLSLESSLHSAGENKNCRVISSLSVSSRPHRSPTMVVTVLCWDGATLLFEGTLEGVHARCRPLSTPLRLIVAGGRCVSGTDVR